MLKNSIDIADLGLTPSANSIMVRVMTTSALYSAQLILNSIVAYIYHVPKETVRSARIATRTALGKAGFVAGGALGMQTAAVVGVASTGTAISTLSGAAAYNSSVAWLGFGSMASGAVVLMDLGAAGGKAFNTIYSLVYAGKLRKAKAFSEDEFALVIAAQSLSSSLAASVEREEILTQPQRIVLALESLAPIAQRLRGFISKGGGRPLTLSNFQ